MFRPKLQWLHCGDNEDTVFQNELRDALNRLRKKTSESHTTINKHETRYKTIEDNLNDIEEGKTTETNKN